MLPNFWYAILSSKELKDKPQRLKRFGMDLVLWRNKNNKVVCMPDRCPHRGVRLSLGFVKENHLVCKYHGFRFSEKGLCAFIPCDDRSDNLPKSLCVKTFRVCEENQLIWFWWGDKREELPKVPWIEEVPKDVWLSHMDIVWPQHYVRSIETNFDGSHFPFVHGSILPNVGEHVKEISCQQNGNTLFCTMTLAHKGASSKKEMKFSIEFLAPNHSIISLNDNYGGLIIDTPIDDRHTWRYMRLSRFPIKNNFIREIFGRAILYLDWLFTQRLQDQPIISTMEPKYPTEGAHHFVKADLGIAKYRAFRRNLRQEALKKIDSFETHVAEDLLQQKSGTVALTSAPVFMCHSDNTER